MNSNKLKAKDLVTVGIFTVVFLLIVFALQMTLGMIPLTYPFTIAVSMLPGGVVWAYMRVKVPKRFTILIQCVVTAILFYLIGSGWFIAVGILTGGVLGELLTGVGKYKNHIWNTIGYAAFGVCTQIGAFAIILLARDYYYEYCITNGMTSGYMDTLMNFLNWPILLLSIALTAVGAVTGMLLGKAMLKKHFEKAGIV
jgi:energy-coupling factor transport system substrate-specific component